jgi:hypothetical protein
MRCDAMPVMLLKAGATLAAIAAKHELPLHWHAGSALRVDRVPPDFRGPLLPRVAQWVAQRPPRVRPRPHTPPRPGAAPCVALCIVRV